MSRWASCTMLGSSGTRPKPASAVQSNSILETSRPTTGTDCCSRNAAPSAKPPPKSRRRWPWIRCRRFCQPCWPPSSSSSDNYDEAIARLERIVQAQPSYARAHFILAQAYAKAGRFDRALAAADRTSALGGDGAELRALVGCISAGAARKSETLAIADELIARYRDQREGGPMNVAVLYAVCNEPDRAFEWLDRAVRERDPIAAYLKIDPWFDGLRSDPRFDALLARLGLTR